MVTPQNQNNDPTIESPELVESSVVINRANLIKDIENPATNTHEYFNMLTAILNQTGDDLESLRAEMIGQLKYEIQNELNLEDSEVSSYTTPIEVKITELLQTLQNNNEEGFREKLLEVRNLIEKQKVEEYISDIFEKDSSAIKNATITYLIAEEYQERRLLLDTIRQKILPTQLNAKIDEILLNEQQSLESKYDMINSIITQNPGIIPGVENLDDLHYLLTEYEEVGVSNEGGIMNFYDRVVAEGKQKLESLFNTNLTTGLAPLLSYKRAETVLKIPKKQLRGLGKLKVSQIRTIIEDDNLMHEYQENKPKTFQALNTLKDKLLQDGGPVDALRTHFLTVANEDSSLTQEYREEIVNFCANLEHERLDTIITGYYCDEIKQDHTHLRIQNFAVLYSWIEKSMHSGFVQPWKRMSASIQGGMGVPKSFKPGGNPFDAMDDIDKRLREFTEPDTKNKNPGQRQPTPSEVARMSDVELTMYQTEYKANVRSMTAEVTLIERQINADINILENDPSRLSEIQTRNGLQSSVNALEELRLKADLIADARRGLETKLQNHLVDLNDEMVKNNRRPVARPGNSYVDFQRGKYSFWLGKGMTFGIPLAASVASLAQGGTLKQAGLIGAETVGTMIPFIGTCLMARQLWTGRDLAGNKIEGFQKGLTWAFFGLSLARDVASIFTGGAAAVAFAGLMSGANTIKNAPALTRIAYHTTKLFTRAGRISSTASASANMAVKTSNMEKAAETVKASFSAWEAAKSIWRPTQSVLTGIKSTPLRWAAAIPVGLGRFAASILRSINGIVTGAFAGFNWLLQGGLKGLSFVKRFIMSGSLRGFTQKEVIAASEVIGDVVKTEGAIAKQILDKQKYLKAGNKAEVKRISETIEKMLNGQTTLLGNLTDNSRKVLDIYRQGSNSALLHCLSKGMRNRELINKAEAYLSYGVLGTAGISLGGGLLSAMTGDSISDFGSGTVNTFNAVTDVAGVGIDAAVYATTAITGHAVARENIHATMERRKRNLALIAEERRKWRTLSELELAHAYVNNYHASQEIERKLRRQFERYVSSRGYSHQRLIDIYNSNLA